MMQRPPTRREILWFSALLLMTCGCSRGPATGAVNGTVTLDGQPLKEGSISFAPESGAGTTAGATIKDGAFRADVPLAKMLVRIHASKVIGKTKAYDTPDSPVVDQVVELIPPQYNVNSTLTIDVQSGSQDVKYDLRSK